MCANKRDSRVEAKVHTTTTTTSKYLLASRLNDCECSNSNNNNSSLQLKVAKTKSKTSTAKTTHLVAHRVQRCQTCDCVFTYANFVCGKWSRIISKHNKINCVLIRETHKKLLNQLHKLRLWLMHIWFFYGFKFGARLGRYLLWLLLLTLNLSCYQCVRVCAQCVCIYVHMLILLFLITYLMLVMLCAFKSLSKCNNCTWTHWLVWMNLDAPPRIIPRSGSRAGCGCSLYL